MVEGVVQAGGAGDDLDDRVAFAQLPPGDDAREPLPMVTDGEVGGSGRPATPDAPRLRYALDDAPRLGVGQSKAGGAMGQALGASANAAPPLQIISASERPRCDNAGCHHVPDSGHGC